MTALGWISTNGTGLNLAVPLLTRHKHHGGAVKNLLTNMSTIVHGLHFAGHASKPGERGFITLGQWALTKTVLPDLWC
jgi:hypothetical protein